MSQPGGGDRTCGRYLESHDPGAYAVRVLVTGATGFIGSHIVRELLARGHAVDAPVRSGASMRRLPAGASGLTTWTVDLSDGSAVASMWASVRPEAVLHLAWYAEPGAYLRNVERNLGSLEDSVRLLRLAGAASTRRVVLAGTCLEGVAPAGTPQEPIYAVSKRALHDVAVRSQTKEMRVTCAHIFSVFGPWEDERRAVPSVIRGLLAGRPVEIGEGLQRRDYVHVADVARAFADILEGDAGPTVDVCSGEARPLREVFEEIGRATGRGDLLRPGARATAADERFDAVGDPAPLRALGWRPAAPFSQRMLETVEWWAAHDRVLTAPDSIR